MKNIVVLLVCFQCSIIFSQDRPKLVIGIVVDQMKMEYLYRFQNDFSDKGFKRLMKNGYTFHNTHYNYFPTYTGPGHASIYTGTTPSTHGIVGNNWFNKMLHKEMYCVEDTLVSILGNSADSEGKMSPRNLLATTITDELKLATNFKGKVIGISLKDRGAILPAGHFADWAFWYGKSGEFISSTYYGEALPQWVQQFNAQKHFQKYIDMGWELAKPKEVYNESLNDNSPYEGKLFKKAPFFPYNLKDMYENNDAGVLRSTPYGNNLIIDFAKKAIENEAMGKDADTDFLALSFSATDYIGHILGPRSIELQDTYIRLDETLAEFLVYLDQKIGKNNYTLFLTADHGGAENVTFLKDNKYDVTNLSSKSFSNDLIAFSKTTYGDDLILNYSNSNVFFDKEKIKSKGLHLDEIKETFKSFIYTYKFVSRVYTEEDIKNSSDTDFYIKYIAKGYDPKQNGELIVLEKPGYLEYTATGTTHGSPYTYDTHVPLLFYGKGINKGKSFERKTITQIAPSLSFLLQLTLPNGTEAIILEELFKK